MSFGTVENYLLMTGSPQERKKVYTDVGNSIVYYCDSKRGTLLTDNKWKVVKCHLDSAGNIEETRTTAGYDNLATNINVVAALTYA